MIKKIHFSVSLIARLGILNPQVVVASSYMFAFASMLGVSSHVFCILLSSFVCSVMSFFRELLGFLSYLYF